MFKWLKMLFKSEEQYEWELRRDEGIGCNESATCWPKDLPRPVIPERRGSPLTTQKAVEIERRKAKNND